MIKHTTKQKNRKNRIKRASGKKTSASGIFSFNPFYFSELDGEGYVLSAVNIICPVLGAVLFASVYFVSLPVIACTVLQAAAVAVAGIPVLRNLITNLKSERILSEALFIAAAAICCFCTGIRLDAILIVILYTALCIARNAISEKEHSRAYTNLQILPDYAYVLDNGEKRRIKPLHILEGDEILVEKSAVVPVDGVVAEGRAALDISPLVRFPESAAAEEGEPVLSGSVNNSEPFVMRAQADHRHSTAQKIYNSFLHCVSEKFEPKVKAEQWAELAVAVLLVLFLLISFVVPLFNHQWSDSIKRGVVFLLCASAFSLAEITDLAVFKGTEKIFASGGVIKNSNLMKPISEIQTFVCNKTCTITENTYKVTEVCPSEIDEDSFMQLLNAVEKCSEHPIAKAIRSYSPPADLSAPREGDSFSEIPGRGVSAVVGQNRILAGNANLLYENGVNAEIPSKQGTAIHLAVNGNYCGYILLENKVRQGSYDAVEKLHSCGVKSCAMLSDDLRSIVRPIAGSLNFNIVKSEMTPEGKISATEYLLSNKTPKGKLAFAGNGYEEYEAASRADISISLGALGNKNAISDFDISVMGSGLSSVPEIVSASKKSMAAIKLVFLLFASARLALSVLALIGICPVMLCIICLTLVSLAELVTVSAGFDHLI